MKEGKVRYMERTIMMEGEQTKVEIAVIRFPGISDFADFSVFSIISQVMLHYVEQVSDLGKPDMVILPGSKNPREALHWMRKNGLDTAICNLEAEKVPVFGICGGFQILGESLLDPERMESEADTALVRGMGLLPIRTIWGKESTRIRVEGACTSIGGILEDLSGMKVEGYEIHMGETKRSVPPLTYIMEYQSRSHHAKMDGCQRGNVYGTYIHGFFHKDGIAEAVVKALIKKRDSFPGR